MSESQSQSGKVWLVGAGPGDPDLLTLRAARLVMQARLIVHDGLVDPAILALARADARLVSVKTFSALSYSTLGSISLVVASIVPVTIALRIICALRMRRLPSRIRTVGVFVDVGSESDSSSSARSALSYCLPFTYTHATS